MTAHLHSENNNQFQQADCTPRFVDHDLRKRVSGFDLFAIAGGVVNLAVIGLLLGYWLLYG